MIVKMIGVINSSILFEDSIRKRIRRPIRFEIRFERKKRFAGPYKIGWLMFRFVSAQCSNKSDANHDASMYCWGWRFISSAHQDDTLIMHCACH